MNLNIFNWLKGLPNLQLKYHSKDEKSRPGFNSLSLTEHTGPRRAVPSGQKPESCIVQLMTNAKAQMTNKTQSSNNKGREQIRGFLTLRHLNFI
jgi:hypothetical protein